MARLLKARRRNTEFQLHSSVTGFLDQNITTLLVNEKANGMKKFPAQHTWTSSVAGLFSVCALVEFVIVCVCDCVHLFVCNGANSNLASLQIGIIKLTLRTSLCAW